MRWCPHRHRRQARGHFVRYGLGFLQNHGQRTWPEPRCKLASRVGNGGDERRSRVERRDVNDQRIVGRPAFRREEAPNGGAIECVRTEAVDRFGGEGYKTATPEALGGTRNDAPIGIVWIHAKYFGHELVYSRIGCSWAFLSNRLLTRLTPRISSGTAAPGVTFSVSIRTAASA